MQRDINWLEGSPTGPQSTADVEQRKRNIEKEQLLEKERQEEND